jgi:hypothetical protein
MNNEDKQMTVISAEIERQRQEMAENNAEARFNDDNPWLEQTYKEMANVNWITIQVLESLLPAEREQMVEFATDASMWHDDDPTTRDDRHYHMAQVNDAFAHNFKQQ